MTKKHKIVISASRRTDIPAFYMDWFMKQIKAGQFEAVNPFNHKRYYVPASPDTVSTIVFWSKNFNPFIKMNHWKTLKDMGYNLFFNFTINTPDTFLEPNLPDLSSRLGQVEFLSSEFGGDCINWRFDPIICYTKNSTINKPLNCLESIAESLSGFGIKRCITSFVDMYGKVKKRCEQIKGLQILPITKEKQIDLLIEMENKLKKNQISLHLCCEKNLFDQLPTHSSITESSCIDNSALKTLFKGALSLAKDSGQRKEMGCKCNKSYDIGSYNLQPCYHNCIYCYANPKTEENRSCKIESKTS